LKILKGLNGLTGRLLIFNLLLAVFPIGSVFFLGTYESQLLESQEKAMVQQGRLLAAALSGDNLAEEADVILERLGGRTDARLRVLDNRGRLLADSARPVPDEEKNQQESDPENTPSEETPKDTNAPEENLIYKVGAFPARMWRTTMTGLKPPAAPAIDMEYYSGRIFLKGPEINAALEGRYGAATRISKGQKSVTLYSAIPVVRNKKTIGVVLVSKSTYSILSDLYKLRLDIAIIFLFSVGAAVILSILLARTVTVPVRKLSDQAESLLDERGKLTDSFKPLKGRDEVADLSRALYRLSSRLHERNRQMEDFMADLVHEIKNPVAGILSAAELAGQTIESENGNPERFLEVIEREGKRIRHLLDDLKELISVDLRLDNGGSNIVETGSFIKNLVKNYPVAEKARIKFNFINNSSRSLYVEISPDRLTQAVVNLMDNAVSFSPENSKINVIITGFPHNGKVRISVEDSGQGVPAGAEEKIFNRWYTDRPEEESSRHTGLGLAIVKGIAEGYGGSINYAGRSQYGGAVFYIELPLSRH
jgi:two-component system sensor histidine kinase ChvG